MSKDLILSESRLDYFREMMNIGGGNAAGVLSQLLGCKVDVSIPEIYELAMADLSVLPYSTAPVVCVKMHMLGDATGDLFFVISTAQKAFIINAIEKTLAPSIRARAKNNDPLEWDSTIIEEIGNILAAAYLRAINSFCRLNIFHSTPTVKSALLLTLLDKSVRELSGKGRILMIKTAFLLIETPVEAFFLMTFSHEFVERLAASMAEATKLMREGKG